MAFVPSPCIDGKKHQNAIPHGRLSAAMPSHLVLANRIFRIFHMSKISSMIPFCNLFMERPSYYYRQSLSIGLFVSRDAIWSGDSGGLDESCVCGLGLDPSTSLCFFFLPSLITLFPSCRLLFCVLFSHFFPAHSSTLIFFLSLSHCVFPFPCLFPFLFPLFRPPLL